MGRMVIRQKRSERYTHCPCIAPLRYHILAPILQYVKASKIMQPNELDHMLYGGQ